MSLFSKIFRSKGKVMKKSESIYTKEQVASEESAIDGLEKLYQEKRNLDQEVEQLSKEGEKLRQDIILFTRAVEEASSRYKLSPDWEGRKAPLMEVRKQLEARKVAYEEKEMRIDREAIELHKMIQQVVERNET